MYKFRILLITFRWPYCVTTEVQHLHMYLFELFILLPPTVRPVHELAIGNHCKSIIALLVPAMNIHKKPRSYTKKKTIMWKYIIISS